MNKTTLVRKLISVNYQTGEKGRFADLHIGKTLTCTDQETGENVSNELYMSYWHPLDKNGLPIDGIIRIEAVSGSWCIMAMTSSRIRTHPEFTWLLELAKELQLQNMQYIPLLRKDQSQTRNIIDAIRL